MIKDQIAFTLILLILFILTFKEYMVKDSESTINLHWCMLPVKKKIMTTLYISARGGKGTEKMYV